MSAAAPLGADRHPGVAVRRRENDYQTTGSGGAGLIAALGGAARAEGRLKVGDLVAVYSGTNDLLSPIVGRDPMFADFATQGYGTPTGSHAQFLVTQAPQLHPIPPDLTLEQAGSYILNLGTVWRGPARRGGADLPRTPLRRADRRDRA